MPEMTHYYAMKNEYQSIMSDGGNIQVSTVQWDVKDGERFDIGFVGPDGRKRACPVILHASSFGSIERTLCAVLEKIAQDAAEGRVPAFPMWLAPTQVRFLPVTDAFIDEACERAHRLSERRVRADVDERGGPVGRRIRDAEREWVPFICLIGEREAAGGDLQVRVRGERQAVSLSLDDLAARVAGEMSGMPFRDLPHPMRISRRPTFFG
jgi:threonyl-tRNA synthetase